MAKREESYVKVRDEIVDTPLSAPVDDSIVIAGVIVSPVGPRLGNPNNQVEFLKMYTKHGVIPRNAHQSLINAYYAVKSTPLVLARSLNSEVLPAVAICKDGSVVDVKSVGNSILSHQLEGSTTLLSGIPYDKESDTLKEFNISFLDTTLYSGEIPDTTDYRTSLYEVNSREDIISVMSTLSGVYFKNLKFNDSSLTTKTSYSIVLQADKVKPFLESLTKAEVKKLEVLGSLEGVSDVVATITEEQYKGIKDILAKNTDIKVEEIQSIESTSTVGSSLDLVCEGIYTNLPKINHGEISTDPEKISRADTDISLTKVDDSNHVFYIVAKTVEEGDKLIGALSRESDIWKIKLNNSDFSYRFSTNPFSRDRNGISNYIEVINTMEDLPFYVIVREDTQERDVELGKVEALPIVLKNTTYSTANSLMYNSILQAATLLQEQERYKIDGLCTFGLEESINGPQIVRGLSTIGQNNKWFLPIGVPRSYKDRISVVNYLNQINLPEPNPIPGNIVLGPFDKDTTLVGFPAYICPGCKYWEKVISNKSYRKEFAPVFEKDSGAMNMANPVVEFTKNDRNILLTQKKPINWITKDARTGVYYLNQNWTWRNSVTTSIIEEENIVRQIWKIDRDVNPILEQFFAKFNTNSTRLRAIDLIDSYFKWNIMNQEYHPVEHRVICDSRNNTDDDINNHRLNLLLEVRYESSIKWITVINRGYPLGVEFTGQM